MGSYLGKNMKKSILEAQEEVYHKQKTLMMQQRQVQLATSFAAGKEQFMWFQAFYLFVLPLCVIGAVRLQVPYQQSNFHYLFNQKPIPLIPLIPLTFVYAYQYDMFYRQKNIIIFEIVNIFQLSNKIYRIRAEAERLMKEEPQLFFLPLNSGIFTNDEYIKALNIKQEKN